MTTFQTPPLYGIGDNFILTESSSYSQGSGASFYGYTYEQQADSAYETHVYGKPASTNESYSNTYDSFYYSFNPQTLIVNNTNFSSQTTDYDSSGRHILQSNYYESEWDNGTNSQTDIATYTYSDENSNFLSSSYEEFSSSYQDKNGFYSDSEIEITNYTYDYTGLREQDINGPSDFTTRWGIGSSSFSNTDGESETFDLFTKASRIRGRNTGKNDEIKLKVNPSGIITYSHKNSDQWSNNNSTYSDIYVYDNDGDGIIDSRSDMSERRQGVNSVRIEIQKDDYDGDGLADYLWMSRERTSRGGTSRTEYIYDTQRSRPILEIIRSADTNSDGIPETYTETAIFRTLTSRHTSMGDHVANISEVMA